MFVFPKPIAGPEAGAGAGGGAPPPGAGAGAPPPGAGAGGAGAPPPAQKSGGGAPPPAAGAGGAPPPPQTQEEFDEWEEGGQKFRYSKSALRTSIRREAAMNRKFEESSKREREVMALAERIEQEQEARRSGKLDVLLSEFKGNKSELLARALKAQLDEEERMADPHTRELMQKAREAEALGEKVKSYEQREADAKLDGKIQSLKREWSEKYGAALEGSPLPKNDIVVGLMRQADRTNGKMGFKLTPKQLAHETMKLTSELVQGIVLGHKDDPEALLSAMPDLTRAIHKALLVRDRRMKESGQAKQVAPRSSGAPSREKEGSKPQLMNGAEIREKTGLFGLV